MSRDPLAPLVIVSVTDPAVQFASDEDREKYEATRDPALYKVRDLMRPCKFTVQPCTAEIAIRLDGMADDATRALLALRACVHRVELPSGEPIEADVYTSAMLGGIAREDWVKTLAAKVGPRRVREIGTAAYRLSMMDDVDPLLQPHGEHPQS